MSNDAASRGTLISTLILEVFRLNGRLLSVGDGLISKLGLTSARWQVLAAIGGSPAPEHVARVAHNMGLRRQGVQRIVNELAEESLVEFQENPHHRRAKLVLLTKKGRDVYLAANLVETPWMNSLSKDIDPESIIAARSVIAKLRSRLDKMEKPSLGVEDGGDVEDTPVI
jgi:DNA-binding MarR family transcriptional regulator